MNRRIWLCILAVLLVFTLASCKSAPEIPETTPPTTEATEPPAPQAEDVYAEAETLLTNAASVTLDVTTVTTMQTADSQFVVEQEQILSYTGYQSDSPVIALEETVNFILLDEETQLYRELYTNGTLYVTLDDTAAFSGTLDAEAVAARYPAPALLDAALYETISMETAGNQTTITFADPTAAELWAMPETAQLMDASGSAMIGENSALQQMTYHITYQLGNVQITKEITAVPRETAETVTAPSTTDNYVPLQCIDALRIALDGVKLAEQADTFQTVYTEALVSQAAGYAQTQNSTVNMVDNDKLKAKEEFRLQSMDAYGENNTTKEELLYVNGKLTTTVDDGQPTSQVGLNEQDVREYFKSYIDSAIPDPVFWSDVVLTDLNGVLLLEFTFTEDYGNEKQNDLCDYLWQDISFLNNLASKYVTNEATGYLAVDACTGMQTASGTYYEGVHTIDGYEYMLTLSCDQSVESPAVGANREITSAWPDETEPEEKAQPLFYHVTGENGQEMWLFGTIHVGDHRTGFLPQEIYDAFAASDALAMEIDDEKFEEQAENDEALQAQVSAAYYYTDGSMTENHVDAEVYELAEKYMKASGNYSANAPYLKVAIWENSISNFYLSLGHSLHSEYGVENRLIRLAKEQEKPIREVETTLFQLQMLTGWSEELQQVMLEDILEVDAQTYCNDVAELYDLWCAGDEVALREAINEKVDTSTLTDEELAEYQARLPLEEEYNQLMSFERNEHMLDVAIEYLESGDVVFYAVGLAHLLDETNGLVDALRQAGYTVEAITYS